MENKNLYLGLGALAVVGLGAYLLFRDKSNNKSEKKSNVAGLPPAGAPVIPNPQPALSPTQMAQPQINPTASYQNIPSAPPSGGGGGAPPSDGGGGHHGGHHGDWNRFGWGGFGYGYPVYLGADYGYNQCLIRNANGTTAIVNCDNMDEIANVDLGVDGSNSNNISNFYYPAKATLNGGFYGVVGSGRKVKSTIGDILISTGRLKKGDKWFDSDSKQCCEVIDNSNTIKCTKAPCKLIA